MLLKKIPPQRIALYIILSGLLPLVYCCVDFAKTATHLNRLEESIEHTQQLIILKEKKQLSNRLVKNFYKEFDHLYIDKQLENLSFLKAEKEGLEKIVNSQAFTGHSGIERRYEFLTQNENHMRFVEGAIQNGDGIRETLETLAHPVEIDEQDLKAILYRIEGISFDPTSPLNLSPPQFLITDFKLTRKTTTENNESFLLNLKLIKREFS